MSDSPTGEHEQRSWSAYTHVLAAERDLEDARDGVAHSKRCGSVSTFTHDSFGGIKSSLLG